MLTDDGGVKNKPIWHSRCLCDAAAERYKSGSLQCVMSLSAFPHLEVHHFGRAVIGTLLVVPDLMHL